MAALGVLMLSNMQWVWLPKREQTSTSECQLGPIESYCYQWWVLRGSGHRSMPLPQPSSYYCVALSSLYLTAYLSGIHGLASNEAFSSSHASFFGQK
jgi:hypothetical protein